LAKPKYRHAHQQERLKWKPVVEAGEAYCAEPVCLIERAGGSRWIAPGTPWHLCHDTTGTIWIGVGHRRCNTSEGARRGNRMRRRQPIDLAAGRWTL